MSLTERQIEALRPREGKDRYAVHDGRGLYLFVMSSGRKYWYARLYEGGGERKVSLGRWPDVKAREARERRAAVGGAAEKEKSASPTFGEVAQEWLTKRWLPTVSPGTAANATSRLRRFVLPALGDRDIRDITPQDVLAVVRPLQEDSIENGQRAKAIVSQVYRYAIAAGLCERDPTAQLDDAMLPTHTARHYAVVTTEAGAAAVMRSVDAYGHPLVRLGLLLLAYTFVRPSEMRLAQWGELDLALEEWRIPSERMKMRRDHIVPLSRQAVAIFREARAISASTKYVFAAPPRDAPLCPTAFSRAMIRMGYGMGKMTPHGFRGMASTLLNEHGFRPDAIERQLAHVERDAVRAAYDRAEHMDERRRMMQWWADHLDELRASRPSSML